MAADGSPWGSPPIKSPPKIAKPERPPWQTWLSVQHADGRPWGSPALVVRTASQMDWRSWLMVTHADGRPWGETVPDAAKLDRWMQKIAAELAAAAGVTVEEAATFAECNRELIEDRFKARTARADVVARESKLSTDSMRANQNRQRSPPRGQGLSQRSVVAWPRRTLRRG